MLAMSSPLPDVAGVSFPGGEYTISAEEHARVCRLLGVSPTSDGAAHPVYGYIATRVGCGYGVEDILAVAGATADDGPMLASLRLDVRQPLLVDTTYAVSGEFTSIERKHGRRAGTFDLLAFDLRLTDPSGDVVLVATQSWVLPRRDA
jgi:hypothetical protein